MLVLEGVLSVLAAVGVVCIVQDIRAMCDARRDEEDDQ